MPNLLTTLKHTLSSRSSTSSTPPSQTSSPPSSPTIPPSSKPSRTLTFPLPFRRKRTSQDHTNTNTTTHPLPPPELTHPPRSRLSRLKSKTARTRETLLLASERGSKGKGKGLTRLPLTEHNIGTLMGELSGEKVEDDDEDGDVVFEEERERARKVEEMIARREGREKGVRVWLEGVSL